MNRETPFMHISCNSLVVGVYVHERHKTTRNVIKDFNPKQHEMAGDLFNKLMAKHADDVNKAYKANVSRVVRPSATSKHRDWA